jgi:2-oxoglutarate ferredoxin oxidoreductase subunit gamma
VLERLIVAGFGGQGVILLGKLLAQAMMDEGKHVTYFPAYGAEVRGGRANCHVIISSDEIFSPVIARADSLIVMSQLSWDFFAPCLEPGGLAVMNSSLVAPGGEHEVRPYLHASCRGESRIRPALAEASTRSLVAVPATDIANELGDVRATNMVMLGAYHHVRQLLPLDALLGHLRAALGARKAGLFDLNCRAIHRGIEAAEAADAGP